MDVKTKLALLKQTDSYWDLLPEEIKEVILMYRESQELIEWRESRRSRALCEQIRLYEQLRRKWFIGPIRCECFRTRVCGNEFIHRRVYGHYWNLNGIKTSCYLHHNLEGAIARCEIVKSRLWYQTNEHVQLPFPEHGP